VLASRAGEVAAATDCFARGGQSAEYRAKANYVAVRHAPGLYSRYYHLAKKSVRVRVGQRVEAGQLLGRSGNTGFSSAPHLHFDVCDVLPSETSAFALADGSPLASCAAAFSADLPATDAPLRAPLVWAEPPTADRPLTNTARTQGAIVVMERCAHVDFLDKVARAQQVRARRAGGAGGGGGMHPCTMHHAPCTMHHAPCTMRHAPCVHEGVYTRTPSSILYTAPLSVCRAHAQAGAVAAVVVNHEAGAVLHTMAYPKRLRPTGGAPLPEMPELQSHLPEMQSPLPEMPEIAIPAIMVDREGGVAISAAISAARRHAVKRGAANGGEAEPVVAGAAGAECAECAEGADQCVGELKRSSHYRTPEAAAAAAAVAVAVAVGVGVEVEVDADAAAATAAAAAGGVAVRRGAMAAATSAFAACTQPVRFYWPDHPEGYMPSVGRWPPRAVQRAAPSPPLALRTAAAAGYPHGGGWLSLGRDRERREGKPVHVVTAEL